jgi:CBS-domain-containing membrane protein
MVTKVLTVGPQVSVREVAKILLSNRISALPVVDEQGELIGIISEGDLARRVELDTNYRRSWWLEMFSGKSKQDLAKEYLKSRGCKVKADCSPSGYRCAARKKPISNGYRLSIKVK